MTVYAVQCPRKRDKQTRRMVPMYDLGEAGAFGNIVELLSPTAKPFNTDPMVDELRDKLSDFGDDDYLICIGNPVLLALSFFVAAEANEGRVKLLQWNNVKGTYVPIDVDLDFTSIQ